SWQASTGPAARRGPASVPGTWPLRKARQHSTGRARQRKSVATKTTLSMRRTSHSRLARYARRASLDSLKFVIVEDREECCSGPSVSLAAAALAPVVDDVAVCARADNA